MDYDKFTREFLKLKPTRLDSDVQILGDTAISTFGLLFKNHHIIFVSRSYRGDDDYVQECFIRLVGTDSEWRIHENTYILVRNYFNCANPDDFFNDINQAFREEKIKSLDGEVTGN